MFVCLCLSALLLLWYAWEPQRRWSTQVFPEGTQAHSCFALLFPVSLQRSKPSKQSWKWWQKILMQSIQQRLFTPTSSHQIKKGLLLILEQLGNLEDDGYEWLLSTPETLCLCTCSCEQYCPTEHSHMLAIGNITFLDVLLMDVSSLKYVWNWASSRINRILSKTVTWMLGCSSWLICLDL